METVKLKWKKSFISKTWERCRSVGSSSSSSSPRFPSSLTKSKSWHCTVATKSPPPSPPSDHHQYNRKNKKKNKLNSQKITPDGCFSVYVGPEKQRFVIKTEFANHPLFKILLEDAESVYGYVSKGPITLPCDVALFFKVLAEIENGEEDEEEERARGFQSPGCGFVCCSPVRHGGYKVLSPSRMLKLNGF